MPVASVKRRPFVVIVDDQATGRRILERMVHGSAPELDVACFGDPLSAIEAIGQRVPDLILTDYLMPGMDGIAFIRRIRAFHACLDVPIIVVTILEGQDVRYQALDAGATDFLHRPIDEYECRARCRNLLTLRHQQMIIRDRAAWLEARVTEATSEIKARERETLLRLAKAGEYRDKGTGDHVLRIARYSRLMAEALGLTSEHCDAIELAAPMHDIGKVGIPDQVLLKPGRLTPGEFEIMKRHCAIGFEILKDSPSSYLQLGATIALHHHERYDGTGYPGAIAAERIPLEARIVAVADVFDALTTARPYKQAWPVDEALGHLVAESGAHFDPECVTAFLSVTESVEAVGRELADEGLANGDPDAAGPGPEETPDPSGR
ncbi:HD domain-containing phosphohydrolase [Thioalkalicoccus limnaeus]|uniref:HD domain-containing phosphohydrolase n=1 Tax=Thioalkalicoccus limnaeus TaxID=120681 RepID=A0ABV4BB36_9GAMM